MVGVFYFPQHLDPLVNVVWQKLRITFLVLHCRSLDIVWQKQRMTFAKQYCTGDPDPPVGYSLTKL
jgi:hypothetical protein